MQISLGQRNGSSLELAVVAAPCPRWKSRAWVHSSDRKEAIALASPNPWARAPGLKLGVQSAFEELSVAASVDVSAPAPQLEQRISSLLFVVLHFVLRSVCPSLNPGRL